MQALPCTYGLGPVQRAPWTLHRSSCVYAGPCGARHLPVTYICHSHRVPTVSSISIPAFSSVRLFHSHSKQERQLLCAAAAAAAVPYPASHPGEQQAASEQNSSLAAVRGFLFYLWTFTLAIPLFVVMLALAPFVALFDKTKRSAQHFVNNIWANLTTSLWYPIEVVGAENLPRNDEPVVYVSNHQSFLDIYTLFRLNRSFKFISKTSNFFIPIVGWSMFLTGHVMLNRTDKRSMMKCLLDCGSLLSKGASVLFFPEGTRSKDGKMAAFKKGAFSVAAKAKVPVVPVTLIGTGQLMPNGQESKLYRGGVKVIVHPMVQPASADEMMDEVRKRIAAPLPPALVAPQS